MIRYGFEIEKNLLLSDLDFIKNHMEQYFYWSHEKVSDESKQTKEELSDDLKEVLKLDITHISYYSLILEEKTTLYHLYNHKTNPEWHDSVQDLLLPNYFQSILVSLLYPLILYPYSLIVYSLELKSYLLEYQSS